MEYQNPMMMAVNGNGTTLALTQEQEPAILHQMDVEYLRLMADWRMSDRERDEQKQQRRREEAYRTELCKKFMSGFCPHGADCRFAHDTSELRPRQHHPNYKTKLCRNYYIKRFCIYGPKCDFIHRTPVLPNIPNGQHFVFPPQNVTNGQQQLFVLPPLSSPHIVLPPESPFSVSVFNFNAVGNYQHYAQPLAFSLPSRPQPLMSAMNVNYTFGYQQYQQEPRNPNVMMMRNNGN